MTATVRELKSMLVEKHQRAEDPIESKLLRVELLRNSSIMEMEDAQTLGATGLLEAEEPTTVIYKRNEAEASTQDDVHALGFFHLNIPSYCDTICDFAFQECQNLVSVTITESVTYIGDYAFKECASLASITLPESMVPSAKLEVFRDAWPGAIITIPARKGRKRPRNEEVSLQICYGPCVWSEQPVQDAENTVVFSYFFQFKAQRSLMDKKSNDHHGKNGRVQNFFVTGAGFLFY